MKNYTVQSALRKLIVKGARLEKIYDRNGIAEEEVLNCTNCRNLGNGSFGVIDFLNKSKDFTHRITGYLQTV